MACVSLFNRLSEECFKLEDIKDNEDIGFLAGMYEKYRKSLDDDKKTDMSLLQQKTIEALDDCKAKTARHWPNKLKT